MWVKSKIGWEPADEMELVDGEMKLVKGEERVIKAFLTAVSSTTWEPPCLCSASQKERNDRGQLSLQCERRRGTKNLISFASAGCPLVGAPFNISYQRRQVPKCMRVGCGALLKEVDDTDTFGSSYFWCTKCLGFAAKM